MTRREPPAAPFSNQRYFQAVIDGLTDDLKVVDRDYRVVFVNATAAQRLFKEPRQILGRKCYEVFNTSISPAPFAPRSRPLKPEKRVTRSLDIPIRMGIPTSFC